MGSEACGGGAVRPPLALQPRGPGSPPGPGRRFHGVTAQEEGGGALHGASWVGGLPLSSARDRCSPSACPSVHPSIRSQG